MYRLVFKVGGHTLTIEQMHALARMERRRHEYNRGVLAMLDLELLANHHASAANTMDQAALNPVFKLGRLGDLMDRGNLHHLRDEARASRATELTAWQPIQRLRFKARQVLEICSALPQPDRIVADVLLLRRSAIASVELG